MDTNIAEKVERYNEIGQVVRVTLRWRGKIYYLQMFFPGSKFPSRGEVETQVKKIYPDAVVMIHYASETQPNQPLIRVTEGKLRYGNYGNYVDGQKKEPSKKEYINPKKLPVANASYEPDGETISEEEEEKKNPTFVQLMQRIEQLPEVTREAIKNCGNDPAIAKAALEISGIDK